MPDNRANGGERVFKVLPSIAFVCSLYIIIVSHVMGALDENADSFNAVVSVNPDDLIGWIGLLVSGFLVIKSGFANWKALATACAIGLIGAGVIIQTVGTAVDYPLCLAVVFFIAVPIFALWLKRYRV